MKITTKQFQQTARRTIESPRLQAAYQTGMEHMATGRAEAYALMPDIEELRNELKEIRRATVENLAAVLEEFERNAQRAGAVVHWAKNGGALG